MSFKRDGDDYSLLSNLQKRRVSDLLVAHIPEDEAILMRNGKYSCTVCSYRPVFDTLDVLAVHRSGKKHMNYLTRYLLRKKKDEEKFMGKHPDKSTIQLSPKKQKVLGDHHGLLKAKPYNSCLKRKPTINLPINSSNLPLPDKLQGVSSSKTSDSSSIVKSYLKSLPKKRNFIDIVAQGKLSYSVSTSFKDSSNSQKGSESIEYLNKQEFSPEEIRKKKECLKMIESGWKKDWRTDKWVQDETVEFDSDEEIDEISETS